MAEKKNWWTLVISTMNGMITFGGIDADKSVRSSVELCGTDGRHFFDMSEDGTRKGWTTCNSPGAFQVVAGEDLKEDQNAMVFIAENGDIVISSERGRIRIEGVEVEITATGSSPQGNFKVLANENVDITASKNLSLNGKQSSKLLTTGLLTLDGKLGMQILSPIIKGTCGATNPRKQPGQIR